MSSKQEVGNIVLEAIRETLAAKGLHPPPLSLTTPIDGSLGLDSLDWATVVVRLEETTGVDPFQKPLDRELRTIEDLTAMYSEMLGS